MSVRKFKIKIDGKLFEAEVEELTEGATAAVENRRETQKPAAASTAPSKLAFSGSEKSVTSPMPGKIIAVKCTQGQAGFQRFGKNSNVANAGKNYCC